MRSAQTVVSLTDVTKRYRGGGGIERVSLTIPKGEVFAFLGPNGAGKTTTIRLLLDLIRPDSGSIRLFDLDPHRSGIDIRRRIGYLPGDLGLYERLTPRQLLLHFAHLRNGPSWAQISRLTDQFALEVDRPIRSLSRGNRQKVGLVQAFMGEPALLILDEPTTGLDPLVQHQVLDLIRRASSDGRTVFLSSHVLSEVSQVADRVGMIKSGKVVDIKFISDLRSRAIHYVDVTFAEGSDAAKFYEIPEIVNQSVHDGVIHLEVAGSLDRVIRALSEHPLRDLSIREPSLEEFFLDSYGVSSHDKHRG